MVRFWKPAEKSNFLLGRLQCITARIKTIIAVANTFLVFFLNMLQCVVL